MKKEYKGSLTIEASLLFPLIMMVIVICIYAMFFMHDRAVLDASAYEAALRGCEITSEHGDVMSTVRATSEETIEGRLLSTKNVKTEVEITGHDVKVRYTGDFLVPGGVNLVPEAGFKELKIKAEGHCSRRNPVSFVRECRTVINTGNSSHVNGALRCGVYDQ